MSKGRDTLAAKIEVRIGLPYPVTLERVARWAPTLAGKGIALVPITAVANLQSE